MNTTLLKTSALVISLGLLNTACDTSKSPFFGPNQAKKLAARKIVVQKTANPETMPQQQPSESVAAVQMKPTEPVLQPKPQQQNFCFELIKKFPDEPYFYNFQANIRKFKAKERAGRYILSHVRHHKINVPSIVKANSEASLKPLQTCAEIILSYQRFQNVRKLANKNKADSTLELAYRAKRLKNKAKRFPYKSCLAVIAEIEDSEDLEGFKDDQIRAHHFTHPLQVMTALLEEVSSKPSKNSSEKITASGCLMAVKSVNSLDEIKLLQTADASAFQTKFKKFVEPALTTH